MGCARAAELALCECDVRWAGAQRACNCTATGREAGKRSERVVRREWAYVPHGGARIVVRETRRRADAQPGGCEEVLSGGGAGPARN